jgi:P4 family phage/plasmid primase-like protien
MSEQNTNTSLAAAKESPQQVNLAHCEHQSPPSKDESEVTAMTSLSEADSVDQTSFACAVIQTEEGEGNPLDEPLKVEGDGIYPEITAQQASSACVELRETALPIVPVATIQLAGSYPILDELRELLGSKVILIPIPQGKKGPVIKGWQTIKLPQTETADYQRALSQGNIGVLLGAPSEGLCAIDIDADDELEGFLEINPTLRNTLMSKGARGAQLWCKIEGYYPPLTKLKTESGQDYGEWRADGGQSIVHGTHPSGVPYKRLNDAPPLTIRFDQIVWPDHVKLPWVKDAADRLTDQYGAAYKFESGLKINEFYFAAKFKLEHPVLWDPTEREFYRYDTLSGLWHCVSTENLKFQLGIDFKHASDQTGIDDFVFARNDARMGACLSTLKGMIEEKDAFKKPDNTLIHCGNGMLDLGCEPSELRTFHPDYRSRNASPFSFDPEAECPEFINGLLKPALDDDDIDLLQTWAGGVLLGKNPAQRLMIIMGTPGGGKSTMVEILEKVIGEQNVAQIRTEHLGKQFEMYKFLGKTLLTGKDVDPDFLNERHASMIKALVGGDLLDAEKKNGNEHFQLRGCFNVAITCNARLTVRLKGDVGAWERRILLLHYECPKPKKRIADFASKLISEEGPGILNWMAVGAQKYMAEVKEFGDIRLTAAQSERVDRLLKESDSLRQFVETRVVKDPLHEITSDELRNGYLDFCEEMGWRAFEAREIKASTADLMMQIHKVRQRHDISRFEKTQRGFKGVRLLEGGAN